MEPQQKRRRPELGCSAIGWMDILISAGVKFRYKKKFRYSIPAYTDPFRAMIMTINLMKGFQPRGKDPRYPLYRRLGGPQSLPVWTQRLEEKSFRLCRASNINRPVVQPVARHYTD
jgi:hypothetical protein